MSSGVERAAIVSDFTEESLQSKRSLIRIKRNNVGMLIPIIAR